jgi:hypothetical protein
MPGVLQPRTPAEDIDESSRIEAMAEPDSTPPTAPGHKSDEELEESLLETFPASDATSGSSVLPPAPQPKEGAEPDAGAGGKA